MLLFTRLRRRLRDESGMSLVFVSTGFMAFFAATTLAIDVGMFMTARTQAQNAADAGALAGATALVYNSFDDRSPGGPAVQSAISTAAENRVMAGTVSVEPGDVTFPLDQYNRPNLVKVDVFRTAARSNPLPTLIGSLFGVSMVDISASATAQAAPARGMTCVKPFIIPDRWQENQDPSFSSSSTFDRYDNKGNLIANPDVYIPGPGGTGYNSNDRGARVVLRSAHGNNIAPTMYYSWKMPEAVGGSFYEENISNCNTSVIDLGYVAQQEPGAMEGPTMQGLRDLWEKDPLAYWDDGAREYKSTIKPSPRVFPIPLYNPDEYAQGKQTGRNATLRVSNWMGFFLEEVRNNEVYGRVFPIAGVAAIEGDGPTNSLVYVIRLVE